MNRQSPESEIDYADYSWNPLVGCSNVSCPVRKVCWARRSARRVAARSGCLLCDQFRPHLHPERLRQPARLKKSAVIATCFMSDICDPAHRPADVARVLDVIIHLAPQHTYLLLTKRPATLPSSDLWLARGRVWLGVSISSEQMWQDASFRGAVIGWFWQYDYLQRWLSLEPAPRIEPDELCRFLCKLPYRGLVVFGAQTRPWECKLSPDAFELLADVVQSAGWCVYFKHNLTRAEAYAALRRFNRLPWRKNDEALYGMRERD